MDPDTLRSQIDYLNGAGGFDGVLLYDKIAEVIGNVSTERADKIFKDLEEKKDEVKDPQAWVTSALRKGRGGGGGGGGGGGAGRGSSRPPAHGGGSVGEGDTKLRKRIGWLNGDGGGFEGSIIYDKVVAASGGLPYSEVMKVLKDLEEKKDSVKDANAWVCSALRKAGGGNQQAAAWGAPPQPDWGLPPAASWGPPVSAYAPPMYQQYAQAPVGAYNSQAATGDSDGKIRKRVDWLNTKGGFGDALNATKVAEAARGINVQEAMKVLKDLEENREKVKDPLAYVTSAMRKLGGGSRGGGGGGGGGGGSGMPPMLSHAMGGWSGPAATPQWTTDVQSEDQKLRKRIGWLNGKGGFDGALSYDKVLEAAGGLEFSEVFRQLQQLEEKKDSVKDPNAWVCVGLRRAASNGNSGGPPQMQMSPQWAAPVAQWGDGYGGPSAMDVDPAVTSKLHKRIKWLNGTGGFNDALNLPKVLEAAAGVDAARTLKVLKDLEEKKDEVKDPTAYVTSALRKAGGGGGGGKGGGKGVLGVKRTISKH